MRLIIPPGGQARAIYSEPMAQLLEGLGQYEVKRASYVEPTEELSEATKERIYRELGIWPGELPAGKWWADLSPVFGPVLGPFDTRQEAIEAELAALKELGL